ncbi:hypothetical protein QBC39DRAFT_358830 [Podospora conica]|nr:hypothetical protein QBC39DRAFT_358830 [Schizothecium conicum]
MQDYKTGRMRADSWCSGRPHHTHTSESTVWNQHSNFLTPHLLLFIRQTDKMVLPLLALGVVIMVVITAIGQMFQPRVDHNLRSDLEERIFAVCNVHQDIWAVTNDDTFPTIYELLSIAPDAGDKAILSAFALHLVHLGEDGRFREARRNGGGLSVAELQVSDMLMEMTGLLLDKKTRRVYDTVFVPAVCHKSAWGRSVNKHRFQELCGKFLK